MNAVQSFVFLWAINHIDAVSCQVVYLLEFVFYAVLSCAAFRQPISKTQLDSILLLVIGVTFVLTDYEAISQSEPTRWLFLGLVFCSAFLSGFVDVYFKRTLDEVMIIKL